MTKMTAERHFLEELSLLETLKQHLSEAQSHGHNTSEIVGQIRGLKLELQPAFSSIAPMHQIVYARLHKDAVAYIASVQRYTP